MIRMGLLLCGEDSCSARHAVQIGVSFLTFSWACGLFEMRPGSM